MKAATLQTITQHWTGQSDLAQVPSSLLENQIESHPYSPSLHLLLAKKYKMDQSPLLEQQIKKATIYFKNPLQVHYWLDQEDNAVTPEVPAESNEKLSTLLSDQLAAYEKEVNTDQKLDYEKEMSLARDYFAAQGIKIDLDKLPQDKFTKQLRSFTAWLKVLKQMEGQQMNPEYAEDQEQIVAVIAEKANKAQDVITESMAEIWVKQGNKRKAIDIYSKLSFIFPEKSVYFASKIEQLKQTK
jgi:hypothetical protein